jgi:hypothetical protein
VLVGDKITGFGSEWKTIIPCEISGSHGSKYEYDCLLEF